MTLAGNDPVGWYSYDPKGAGDFHRDHRTSWNDEFCGQCGRALWWFCAKGHRNRDDNYYCTRCGKPRAPR